MNLQLFHWSWWMNFQFQTVMTAPELKCFAYLAQTVALAEGAATFMQHIQVAQHHLNKAYAFSCMTTDHTADHTSEVKANGIA
jgi:hypothetical protein